MEKITNVMQIMNHSYLYNLQNLRTEEQAKECAAMMAASDPWLRLGRTYKECLDIFLDKKNHIYVIKHNGEFIGFIVINLHGSFTPYIQSIVIKAEYRGKGIGTQLIKEIE